MILDLHRLALDGLSQYAGNFRPSAIEISQSKHVPPPAHRVTSEIDDMCDYVMNNFESKTAVHLCAYVMWRLNWIHPFTDGNGRTSRALSYFVLCAKVGYRLPGQETIPEQIAANKPPYYDVLERADEHWANGDLRLDELEALLQQCLAKQLLSAYQDAKNPKVGSTSDRKLH
jgi:Fic family protein